MAFIIVCSLFVIPFILWRKLYFKPLSAALINAEGDVVIISCKPSRRDLKHYFSCYNVVKVGFKHICFFESSDESLDMLHYGSDVCFKNCCIVFSVGFFGRLNSVDVSQRSFNDVISKFKK